ncbi:MAG: hypothetical protein WCR42_04835 [bacterium]
MKKQKTFDSVELQRSIRNKLVQDSDMNLDKFFILINEKKKNSIVYKKLSDRIEKEKAKNTKE